MIVALRQSEDRYRQVSETISDYAFATRVGVHGELCYEWATQGFTTTLGYTPEEVDAMEDRFRIVHPEDRDAAEAHFQKLLAGTADTSEFRVFDKDGKVHWLRRYARPIRDEGTGRVCRLYGSVQDITDRKRAEEEQESLQRQLAQTQKMEAVGQLAGGIAHDFNNLLTIISGNLEIVREAIEQPGACSLEETLESITIVQDSATRAVRLTRQLLTFSRQETPEPTVLDLSQVITDMESILRRLIREDIELEMIFGPDACTILADRQQIEQILLNLAGNARDAMPDGGRLTIRTAQVMSIASHAATEVAATARSQVLLSVSDTGCGMDERTRERIFEPFFTTKPVGRGTGIGLATVYGIVKQLGGEVSVQSSPGVGTTFLVQLPATDQAEKLAPVCQLPASGPRGQETVLLCEDEANLMDFVRRALQSRGYTVLAAEQAEEALAITRTHPGDIHLLLTDVIMPGMNGRELAERAQAARPQLQVLYMSGYTADVLSTQHLPRQGTRLLEKPFTAKALAQRVRLILDERKLDRPSED